MDINLKYICKSIYKTNKYLKYVYLIKNLLFIIATIILQLFNEPTIYFIGLISKT